MGAAHVPGARDIAGHRYAIAAMEIARADQSFEQWAEAMQALDVLTSDPRLVSAMESDGMTDERFQAIVRRVYPEIGQKELNLFRLLRRKNRLALGPSIASFFRELLDEERGVARAVVTTAIELDDEQLRGIARRLVETTGRQVVVESRVDPSIIGGLVIRLGDRLIDGSVRARLRGLRTQLERAAV
jgi:F-type H+-transporting ATPase subunit delta